MCSPRKTGNTTPYRGGGLPGWDGQENGRGRPVGKGQTYAATPDVMVTPADRVRGGERQGFGTRRRASAGAGLSSAWCAEPGAAIERCHNKNAGNDRNARGDSGALERARVGRSQMPSQCGVGRAAVRAGRPFACEIPGGAGGLRVAMGRRPHELPRCLMGWIGARTGSLAWFVCGDCCACSPLTSNSRSA